MIVGEVATF